MRNKAPNSTPAGSRPRAQMSAGTLRPGDEAARGTPGTGEDICPECQGQGRVDGRPCPNCGGSGKIIRGIGGA